MSMAAVMARAPGFGWLNVFAFLFAWNAMKFAWMAIAAPLLWINRAVRPCRADKCEMVPY